MADRSKDKEVQMMQQAPVCDPRWYFSIGGGADFNVGDTSINKKVDAFAVAFFTNGFIKEHSYDDVYDTGWRIQGEAGYALTEHLEIFGLFKYAHADAVNRTSGSAVVTDFSFFGGPTFVFPIGSEFEDYDSWGGELGFRFYFLPRAAHWRPYLAVAGGVSHVDAIGITTFADLSDLGGPRDQRVFNGAFFDETWIGSGSATLGLEYNVTCHWTVGVNGGIRYESKLSDDDRDLSRQGFRFGSTFVPTNFATPSNNDSGDRWTVPVTGYVKFRF